MVKLKDIIDLTNMMGEVSICIYTKDLKYLNTLSFTVT